MIVGRLLVGCYRTRLTESLMLCLRAKRKHMKRSELIFTTILIPLDLIAAILGFVAAYYIRKHLDPFNIVYIPPLREYLTFLYYFLPAWLLVFSFFSLYNVKANRKFAPILYRIMIAVPTALMLFVTTMFFIQESFFSRLIILYALALIITATILFRLTVFLIRRFLFRFGIGVKRVLVIGTSRTAKEIIKDIERHPGRGLRIIGIVKVDGKMEAMDQIKSEIVGFINELGSLVTKLKPDEIIQTEPFAPQENLNIINLCEDKHIVFRYVPSMFALYSTNNDSDTLGRVPVFEIKRSNLDGWGRIFKRVIDIIGALIGIMVSLPIQAIVAFLIKVTDPGPVFFVQERVGRDGTFRFIKFRTMKLALCTGSQYGGESAAKLRESLVKTRNESSGPMFKMKDDPRVSRIGRFLRKTSLDEIPQFYNILKGDMSLVGPRPPLPGEVAKYTREERKRIIGVKPGITGMWQVSGRSEVQFEEWVALDKYYIENWSLFLDFIIILKTIWVVIFGKGAY
jgi:exopolysaccharide biosynthesis polyprenyl glycosylphosphotransferase